VGRIANANGKPIETSSGSSSGGSGGTSPLITFGIPILILIVGAVAAARLRRRGSAAGPAER
jgi:hypothetical protein